MAWDHPWVDEMLVKWGIWVRVENRAPIASMRFDGMPPLPPSDVVRSWIPLSDLECCETDRFVGTLVDPWKSTVIVFYTSDASVESKARAVKMSTRTLYAHVRQVHQRYILWLDDRKRARALRQVA